MSDIALEQDTVKCVQNLIRAHIDAYDGMTTCTEAIDNEDLQRLLRQLATERSSMANELQEHVEWNGEQAAKASDLPIDLHEAWLNIRSKADGDASVVLADMERLESVVRDAYEQILMRSGEQPLNAILLHHISLLKSGQEEIQALASLISRAGPLT